MALIKCYECGKEISDKAISCPNCGDPRKQDYNKNKVLKNDESSSEEILIKNKTDKKNQTYLLIKKYFLKIYVNIVFTTFIILEIIDFALTGPVRVSIISGSAEWYILPSIFILPFVILPFVILYLTYFKVSSRKIVLSFINKRLLNIIVSVIISIIYGVMAWRNEGDGGVAQNLGMVVMLLFTSGITGIIMIFKKDRSNWSSMLMWTTIVCSILSLLNKYAL